MAVLLLIASLAILALAAKQKVYYLDVEGINVTYLNPKYYADVDVSARRFGRKDPIHYVHVHGRTLAPLGNNATIDVIVHEFLSNEYRRSFVEMHYKLCDLILDDEIFGPYLNKGLPKTCPIPKGEYHLVNMSIPDLPLLSTFPFTKGRVFANTTLGPTHIRLIECYIDVVIKQRLRKVYYMDVERINVTYLNPNYYADVNVSARRFGRKDPIHYVHAHGRILAPFGNDVSIEIVVYEFLSNEYRRSFVEMHFKLCDLLLHDKIFGPFINKDLPKTCPIPKGEYHLVNISVPDLPLLSTFPFTKGRGFVNATIGSTHNRLIEGYGDVVIKQRLRKV